MNKITNITSKISYFFRNIEIKIITFYQRYISPKLGNNCRFYPTCSEYTKQAVDKYGIIKGNLLGIYRILRCNPFSHGGIDNLK